MSQPARNDVKGRGRSIRLLRSRRSEVFGPVDRPNEIRFVKGVARREVPSIENIFNLSCWRSRTYDLYLRRIHIRKSPRLALFRQNAVLAAGQARRVPIYENRLRWL